MSVAIAFGGEEPTFRAESRMLQVEVLVRDARRQAMVEGLAAEDFELRVDGRRRSPVYVRRAGERRRPLAILVYLNLAREGGLRTMGTHAAREAFSTALGRLEAEDEVAVYAADDWFEGRAREVVGLTRDRETAARALAEAAEAASGAGRRRPGGGDGGLMTQAVEAARRVARERPGSLVTLLSISDSINTLDTLARPAERELAERVAEEANLSVSAIHLPMVREYAAAAAVLNPLGAVLGYSLTGAAARMAEGSGGVVLKVEEAGGLAGAFDQLMQAYAGRYVLEVRLAEDELRDGRLHRVEVGVKGYSRKDVHYRRRVFAAR
ncbi:MAG: hypothetical protein SFV54_23470 [Bryobacteraceae bacterium]|nr:hypothetical protein [Bryobacteraceae bacterium]